MIKYDYLIVGAGLYGSVFAYLATQDGKKCLVIDRRDHIGGNVYTQLQEGINVHKYGAHIFHTSNEEVWNFINKFARFNNYVNTPVARYKNGIYNLPFNMNTFVKLWSDVFTPEQAKQRIYEQIQAENIKNPANLEEQALSLVGREIYEKLIKGYTEKQWGRDCKDLPAFIIKRLPLRFTFNNNYFNDIYQGIPIGGYTPIIEKLLENCDLLTNTDYKQFIAKNPAIARKTLYTGSLDELFDYRFGKLCYRTVRFETELLQTDNFQGNAVVNYTEREIPYTRIIEHKHFEFGNQPHTIISKEYPCEWKDGLQPYYPVNDAKNAQLYSEYLALAKTYPDLIVGGRLGNYTYYDMDKVIQKAMDDYKNQPKI